MRRSSTRRRLVLAAAVLLAAVAASTAPTMALPHPDGGQAGDLGHHHPHGQRFEAVRRATDRFHRLSVAERAGYGVLADAAGLTCIEDPGGAGGMGVHYVNGALVGDGTVDPLRPEALIYRQTRRGHELMGVEYVVFVDAWGADRPPPRLFGHEFHLIAEPNRYGLRSFYALHAWVWYDNPAGILEDWNPRVRCDPQCP
jgi:hypothetical protein